MDPVYLTELMGGIGKCVLSIECVVPSIPIIKQRFWSVRLHGVLGPFWDDLVVCILAEVRVRDWRYCVIRMGD